MFIVTDPEQVALRTAAARLMYENNRDIRDFNALVAFIDRVKACNPPHIDRSKWAPCKLCDRRESPCLKDNCIDKHGGNIDCSHSCRERLIWESMCANIRFNRFCPKCGRPLTTEAWADLEKRLISGEQKEGF